MLHISKERFDILWSGLSQELDEEIDTILIPLQ